MRSPVSIALALVLAGCGGDFAKLRSADYAGADAAACDTVPLWLPALKGPPVGLTLERSYCLFRAAVETRNGALCERVKRIPLLGGKGLTHETCDQRVAAERQADQAARLEPGELHRFLSVNFAPVDDRLWVYLQALGTIEAYYRVLILCTEPDGDGRTLLDIPSYRLEPGLAARYRIDLGKESSDWLKAHRKPDVKCEARLTPVGMPSERWERARKLVDPKTDTTVYEFRLAAK
jgi:hypothetical protein